MVRNDVAAIRELFQKNVVPNYARFDLMWSHGKGSYLWDVTGKRYLDLGAGIAVCALGHAHHEIAQALRDQAEKLVHVSNLYYFESQGRLAETLVRLIGPGKCFFCNSGAEADEGLFKLARRFGSEEGRFEILTALNSFHGRTLGGISATGQDKVKKGFGPMVEGFRHVPFNDLEAMRAAISPATAAILIEGIQGETGVIQASPEYLLGLRRLCDEKNLLLLIDAVQCGYFRTGRFQSFQRILEGVKDGAKFLPDGIAMAKSLGGGYPIGAIWVREPYADLLALGSHGATFGGSPLACAVALKAIEVVEREDLAGNARKVGEFLKGELAKCAVRYSDVVKEVRGLGFMIGLELQPNIPAFAKLERPVSLQFIDRLHRAGLLAIPSGTQIVRLLPPLNLSLKEAEEGLELLESVVAGLSSKP